MRIALIGSAPSSVELAPYADPDWQIWACSPGAYAYVTRADAWFELHRWEPGKPWFAPDYVAFMAGLECPVHMIEPVPEIPGAVAYPKAEMLEAFGRFHFSSSLSWMFAMALKVIEAARAGRPYRNENGDIVAVSGGLTAVARPSEFTGQNAGRLDEQISRADEVDEIGIWGVDMSATEEYGFQRAGCQHFIEIARARGIKITIPPESDLLQPPPLYGLGEAHPMRIKLMARKAELEGKMAEAVKRGEQFKASWEQSVRETLYFQGAVEDVQYMLNTWCE